MNRNVIIVLVGGMLIAILVAVLVQASLSGGKKKVETQDAPKVKILVAAKDLDVGSGLGEKNVKWHEWPKNAVFPGAIVKQGDQKASEAAEGLLRRNIAEGEPITKSALVAGAEGNFLAATLGDNMRAVAVKVKAVTMAGGFISPGDYVDVILTYKASMKKTKNPIVDETIDENLDRLATETIMENVRVMAVDQALSRSDEKVKVGKTVTLEVDRKGAETLALAEEMGDISLALRKLGDKAVLPHKMPATTDARLSTVDDELRSEIVKAKKSSGQDANIVRIYNGSSVQTLSVNP